MSMERNRVECFWDAEREDLEAAQFPAPLLPCTTGEELKLLRTRQALSPALVARIRALATESGSTPFHLYLAAYFAVLRIYSECDQQIIGVPALRGEDPSGPLIVRLRVNPADSYRQTVGELTRRCRELSLHAPAGSLLPFCFSLLDDTTEVAPLDRVAPPMNALPAATQSKFSLQIEHRAADFTVALQFQRGALDPLMAERFLTHFTTFLWASTAAPGARLAQLSVLAPAERAAMAAWGLNAQSYPKGRTVTDLFEELAQAQPEATALIADSLRVSYRELDQQANAIAWMLHRLGVACGEHVPLLLPRGVPFVACALGALKIGAAYVPIDPDLPAVRRERLLRQLNARVGLRIEQAALGDGLTWLTLDGAAHRATSPPPRSLASANDPAYVMFTSGSTGIPKGVQVPHRGIVRLVRGQDFLTLGSNEAWLQLAPTSFDASTLELWAPLLNGGRCIFVTDSVPTPEVLAGVIAREGATSAWFTASLFNVLIEEAPECLAGLAQILVGGEVLSPAHVRRALERLPRSRLINGYGPTENTTFTCCHHITPADVEPGRSVPIGRPIANTTVRVLDRDGNSAPLGVAGELVVGGEGVALGYVGMEEQTRQRFLPDPAAVEPGALCYRTGDRVRWRSEGVLEFLGRFDEQLKINGHRIEPGEIAAVLTEHPAVRQAAVVPQRGLSGDAQLVAYIVPRPLQVPQDLFEQLGRHLAACLPAYMKISGFACVAALPLTANGKLDASALPPVAMSVALPVRAALDTPTGDAAVLALISELLGQPVSRHDNLYALGADSLRLVRLVARLKSRLGLDLPIGEVTKRGDVGDILSLAAQRGVSEAAELRAQLSELYEDEPDR
jgi:amino acid adenylation domain-containing protein